MLRGQKQYIVLDIFTQCFEVNYIYNSLQRVTVLPFCSTKVLNQKNVTCMLDSYACHI